MAAVNKRKHEISFEFAASVFKDPNAVSIFDDDHTPHLPLPPSMPLKHTDSSPMGYVREADNTGIILRSCP